MAIYDSERDRQRSLTRRAALLGGVKLAAFSVLAGRLYQLQILQAARYATLADDNRINHRRLPPARGRILDRFGAPLAVNEPDFRVLLVPERTPNLTRTLARLAELIALPDSERARIHREVAAKQSFIPVTVRTGLSWRDVSRVEVHAPELPGVSIDVGQLRAYPLGRESCHAIGYVGPPGPRALREGPPVLALPGMQIGKAGIEKRHEEVLRGRPGRAELEVNAVGRVVRRLARQAPVPGADIQLSLDADLQHQTSRRLARLRSGAAVIMDAVSGEVLALDSAPGFVPGHFVRGLSEKGWAELSGDATAPLINKVVAGQYPPGSTFKMVTALAGLESGAISPETTIDCPGHLDLGDRRFHCWKDRGHGEVDLHKGLVESCDVYFYELARRAGIAPIARAARKLGLGAPTGIDLPGEKPGLIPDPAWKRARYGTGWQTGESLNTAIGQGFVLTTPIQLAVMTARLVNGGRPVRPFLTLSPAAAAAAARPALEGAPVAGVDALARIRAAMVDVAGDPYGTAWRARIRAAGMAMGGKTGTAQVRGISPAEHEAGLEVDDLPWRERHHALFVGFAPVAAPRYVAAVVVEHGGSGSRAAAPVARDLLRLAQMRAPAGRYGARGGAGAGGSLAGPEAG